MENEILKICACAVLCAIVGAVIGRNVGGVSTALRISGLAAVFGGVIGLLGTAVELLWGLGIDGMAAEYATLMLKGLGIAVLCRICADICKDCGEPTVALAVESAGKLGIIIIAMPCVADIIALADELLEGL